MKVKDWLDKSTTRLKQVGIATARLDTLVLLADIFAADKSYILAHLDLSLSLTQQKLLDKQLTQRLKHFPLAYVRGKTEFYGREFLVNEHTLEPRPESETMIELVLDLIKSKKLKEKSTLVDVGTGSGALGITIKLEESKLNVIGTEISPEVIKVAGQNAQKLGANVEFYQGDLLTPIPSTLHIDVIMANLPYVPDDFTINAAAMQEPKLAIFGGPDGLDVYRQLFEQIDKLPSKPKYALTESMPPQHKKLTEIAKSHGYKLQKTDDFIQIFVKT